MDNIKISNKTLNTTKVVNNKFPIIKINFLYLILILLFGIGIFLAYKFLKTKILKAIPDYEKFVLIQSINGKNSDEISKENIPVSNYGNEYNFSFWIKIDSYSYNNGVDKNILLIDDNLHVYMNKDLPNLHVKVTGEQITNTETFNNIENQLQEPNINEMQNFLENVKHNNILDKVISQNYDMEKEEKETTKTQIEKFASTRFVTTDECIAYDIDLQRWNHISINVYDNKVDIFVNGMLSSSCNLNVINKNSFTAPLLVNTNGGFDGELKELTYSNIKLSSRNIYNLYKKGP